MNLLLYLPDVNTVFLYLNSYYRILNHIIGSDVCDLDGALGKGGRMAIVGPIF